jgi:hypothetical protein
MGTWAVPKTHNESVRAKAAIDLLKSFRIILYPIIGDDELFDSLDGAIRRMERLFVSTHLLKGAAEGGNQ